MNDAPDDLEFGIGRAAQALIGQQRSDGHWVFELEADATIPSEYVLLRHYLGEPDDPELERHGWQERICEQAMKPLRR